MVCHSSHIPDLASYADYATFVSPGRFFASMEIKLVLAYLIANYEMKWPESVYDYAVPGNTKDGYRPPENCHGHGMSPDTKAKMMIRKRVLSD
jgi:hypothetical protein